MAANDMSGLASLAMAIDHLDEVQKTAAAKAPVEARQQQQHHDGYHAWDVSNHTSSTRMPLPNPQTFVETRVVSVEQKDPPKNTKPKLKEEEWDEAIELLLKNNSTNGDKSDPPAAPPAPDQVIDQVLENDVLCGRGGETNNHVGNITYRDLVKKYQRQYLKAKRRVKPKIARAIVDTVRRSGGRFLKKIPSENTWRDVGNIKAREKTSQALREGAPELRVDGVAVVNNKKQNKSNNDNVMIQQQQHPMLHPHHPYHYYAQEQELYKKRKQSPTSSMLGSISPDANLVSPTPSSSGSFQDAYGVRSVSSSDSDDLLLGMQMNKKQKRGPRLAILKARLQES